MTTPGQQVEFVIDSPNAQIVFNGRLITFEECEGGDTQICVYETNFKDDFDSLLLTVDKRARLLSINAMTTDAEI